MGMILLLLFFPLVSFFLALALRQRSFIHKTASILVFGSFLISVSLFLKVWNQNIYYTSVDWFALSKKIVFDVSFLIDNLSVLLLVIVTLVSSLVHLFSIEYMKDEPHKGKYFAFLGLFTFSMLGIVLSGNLLITFMFWELVGLSSYLLIGFWYQKDSAAAASKKAFLVNRIGDIGFLLGLAVVWSYMGSFDILTLKKMVAGFSIEAGNIILSNGTSVPVYMMALGGFGICCGAIGKSAQFPLQIWLPDAMEGPTPVSALIHAATMVAAGVFLVARVYFLIHIDTLMVMAILGAITAFMGAFSAFTQHDTKKVLAFSTISQLGYMVIGLGVGAMDTAIFHLTTHAFFKACLFLAAGSIIHALHKVQHHFHDDFDPQDMRVMGGLRKKMPLTFYAYLAAMSGLAGIPFFSGFLSKDGIITSALAWAQSLNGAYGVIIFIVPFLALISALMTAVYMGRQLFLVFFGTNRLASHEHYDAIKENNGFITIPLVILALLSFGFVFSFNPFSGEGAWLLDGIQQIRLLGSGKGLGNILKETAHHLHFPLSIGSGIIALTGFLIAYFMFGPKSSYSVNYKHKTDDNKSLLMRLSFNHWYLNNLYQNTFVRLFNLFKNLSKWFESHVIDRVINLLGIGSVILAQIVGWADKHLVDGLVNRVADGAQGAGNMTRSIQGGRLQSYVIWLFVGLILLVSVIFVL